MTTRDATSSAPSSGRAETDHLRFAGDAFELSAVGARHLAALHRGLLVILTLAVLTLLPAIVRGGSDGPAWTDRRDVMPDNGMASLRRADNASSVRGDPIWLSSADDSR